MKIVIAGGTGHVGSALTKYFLKAGHEVVVLSRGGQCAARVALWDAVHAGSWFSEVDGSDLVINLAGRTVDCRYTQENLQQMLDSRVFSTRIIGEAIRKAKSPPKLWLQMSTATIYAHRFTEANDEFTGIIGGNEVGIPAYWKKSIDIAIAWEKTLAEAQTGKTRKVALRTAMVMGKHPESIFGVLSKMARLGLGGAIGGGQQFVSWIHESDFISAVEFIIQHEELNGAINICAPEPLPQKEFMRHLRKALHVTIGFPATAWMAEIGAFILRTDTELLLKSRRVQPGRLLKAGFQFKFPQWSLASQNLAEVRQK